MRRMPRAAVHLARKGCGAWEGARSRLRRGRARGGAGIARKFEVKMLGSKGRIEVYNPTTYNQHLANKTAKRSALRVVTVLLTGPRARAECAGIYCCNY